MKNILLLLIPLLISAQQIRLFAQIDDIKSIPFQSSTLEYIESTPIIINDNELLIIYATNHKVESPYAPLKEDTVYAVRSFNAGKNWEQPNFIRNIKTEDRDKNKPFYLSTLKISAGRILLCWSDWRAGKISIIHSDDNGLTWSDTAQIKGGGNVPPLQRNSLYNINLSELTDGRIMLNFNSDFPGFAYYRVSYDLGETWSEGAYIFSEPQSSQPDLKDVSMIEIPTKGIIAFFEAYSSTAYSSIYKKISTDGGETWNSIFFPDSTNFTDLAFVNENEGWVSGIGIKYTSNGGETWEQQYDEVSSFHSINLIDENVGYATGDDGLIIKTTNGGKNWMDQKQMFDGRLWSIDFINANTGWVAGQQGTVLKTSNDGGSFVIENQKITTVPNGYSINQNYPNPFNPNTLISYQIPHQGFVTLKVFDVLGREVETLVDEEKTAGSYIVDFSASNLASGVYIYRMKANDFIESKKMILLR